jgi:hypothetical protein
MAALMCAVAVGCARACAAAEAEAAELFESAMVNAFTVAELFLPFSLATHVEMLQVLRWFVRVRVLVLLVRRRGSVHG